jgi:hypothetical protein
VTNVHGGQVLRGVDPRYVLRLAVDGGFNAIVLQIGLAEKFYRDESLRVVERLQEILAKHPTRDLAPT